MLDVKQVSVTLQGRSKEDLIDIIARGLFFLRLPVSVRSSVFGQYSSLAVTSVLFSRWAVVSYRRKICRCLFRARGKEFDQIAAGQSFSSKM